METAGLPTQDIVHHMQAPKTIFPPKKNCKLIYNETKRGQKRWKSGSDGEGTGVVTAEERSDHLRG